MSRSKSNKTKPTTTEPVVATVPRDPNEPLLVTITVPIMPVPVSAQAEGNTRHWIGHADVRFEGEHRSLGRTMRSLMDGVDHQPGIRLRNGKKPVSGPDVFKYILEQIDEQLATLDQEVMAS